MKIICVGRNYVDHIAELNNERPSEPVLFIKPDTALLGKEIPFVIPEFSEDIHYEVELVLKVCKVGKYIDVKFAHKYYDQISLGIDFTARDLQSKLKEKGLPWEKAKGFDGSANVGTFFSKDELPNLFDTEFLLKQNGNVVQKASTAQMIWNIDEIIAEVSKYFTLKTGDLIYTGTPAGVGKVNEGDVLEGEIAGRPIFRLNVK
ncbi:fumarylacetoacetate hydrolase family protein [Myroides phaeus]|uniref:2-keto-4-pentenoate hydratase/2-oxohepta-3-ene-1,7-dioic acid hydratase (Catechol pathway) n=1 Tax=Myroides phaeus TaxID=702745 RepID=A0A1G8F977_9FLAO|nr:fumarylacetoacetate hydrolase family protein [Myroides phaeus]MEC4116854.1 fumarylacetoacetate hydrolase family protein [Myroides phaeus]SDH78704.1 2-keto-4-pentenoate hydratase/2-oxohepta-3-ene-1,7-dioic acid hydratase (catechol pathway) [Myroides phaeus]